MTVGRSPRLSRRPPGGIPARDRVPVQPPRLAGRGPRRPDGPRLGPIQLTPVRGLFGILIVGTAVFNLATVLIVRDEAQIPMLTAGLLVFGIISAALSFGAAVAMWQAARDGRAGRAMLLAIAGGLCGLAAILWFTGSVVLGLLLGS